MNNRDDQSQTKNSCLDNVPQDAVQYNGVSVIPAPTYIPPFGAAMPFGYSPFLPLQVNPFSQIPYLQASSHQSSLLTLSMQPPPYFPLPCLSMVDQQKVTKFNSAGTPSKQKKPNQKKVLPIYVLKGTSVKVDPMDYENKMGEIEIISAHTLHNRKSQQIKSRCVLKGTAEEVNAQHYENRESEIEWITPNTLYNRKNSPSKKCVLKGTTQEVNAQHYKNRESEIEWITANALCKRKLPKTNKSKCVLKGTSVEVNAQHYENRESEIEWITPSALSNRKLRKTTAKPQTLSMCVLKGTSVEVDPKDYKNIGNEIEWITEGALAQRKTKNILSKCVLKGTSIEVDPKDYENKKEEIEMIRTMTLVCRKYDQIESKCVLKDTSVEVNPEDYADKESEIERITPRELSNRKSYKKISKDVSKDTSAEIALAPEKNLSDRKKSGKNLATRAQPSKRKNNHLADNIAPKRRKLDVSSEAPKKAVEIVGSKIKFRFNQPLSTDVSSQTPKTKVEIVGNKIKIKFNNPISTTEIKQEEGLEKEVYSPVLILNIDEFRRVVKRLNAKASKEASNCAYLAEDFINYLHTKKIPEQATIAKSCSLAHFMTTVISEEVPVHIKNESDLPGVPMVVQSLISRDSEFPIPLGETYREENEQMDLSIPIYDLNNHNQKTCIYSQLNAKLREEARISPVEISFGIVNLGRCGEYIHEPGHMIVYFATPDMVVFIDCQCKDPIFYQLENSFQFASTATTLTEDTFGDFVFYVPLIKIHRLTHESLAIEEPKGSSPSIYSQAYLPTLFAASNPVNENPAAVLNSILREGLAKR